MSDIGPGTVGRPLLGPLCAPARLAALAETGLGARSSPEMEEMAATVRRWLDVPVSLVTLVTSDQQVFPGMVGLPEPWAGRRSTPLSHSFCQQVVSTAEPLIVQDARVDDRVRDNLAIPDLGVVAYAGMPLTDADGNVLGALCAIDVRPRRWTDRELADLRELARLCSTDLRLRLSLVDADRERRRRDELEQAMRASVERSQTLLLASQAMTRTTTVDDVRERVGELVETGLAPCYVGLSLVEGTGRPRRMRDERRSPGPDAAGAWAEIDLDSGIPSATAVREQRIIRYPNRELFDADQDEPARAMLRTLGLHALVAAPLRGTEGTLGALVLGWDSPREFSSPDMLLISTIASYAGQALDRARLLQNRIEVADHMQRAMLTALPTVDGLEMAESYRPADAREAVGGDWYDVTPLIDPRNPDDQVVAVSVGDILGHSVAACVLMGQVRSMLRQAAWDHPDDPPSGVLHSFERASEGLGLGAAGTALLAHLRRSPGGRWSMTWTNAGHPPPILIRPDARPELLNEHGMVFGYPGLLVPPRTDHYLELDPGTVLLLYSDGLVELPGVDIDLGIARVADALDDLRGAPTKEIVETLMAELAAESRDDVIIFALRFGGG